MAAGSEEGDKRSMRVGELFIILGIDGVARTFEVTRVERHWLHGPRVEITDTGIRPHIRREDA